MTHPEKTSEEGVTSQEAFEQMVKERLQYAVRIALISVLEEEVTAFIGAKPYERSEERRDHRNGHYTRHLETTVGQIADLPVPRTRHGYHTQLFERYHRRRDELESAIGEMFVRVSQHSKSRPGDRDVDGFSSKPPGRSLVCFLRWRPNMSSGNSASWLSTMPMRSQMGPTSRSSTMQRAGKCRF